MRVLVIGASRRRPAGEPVSGWLEFDFGDLTTMPQWLPLLQDVDAVVNCMGIIREQREGDFERLHRAAPVALFAACEQLGVRVVQVSALGSHPQAASGYWRSKGAAEADLLARQLAFTIIRPSLVYGENGASSVLFRMLATLPVLLLPAAHRALVQPIHVDELAEIVVRLLVSSSPARAARTPSTPDRLAIPGMAATPAAMPRELAVVGPRAMTMAAYLADLRRGMRAPAALGFPAFGALMAVYWLMVHKPI